MKPTVLIALIAIAVAGSVGAGEASAAPRHGARPGAHGVRSAHQLRAHRPLHHYSALARAYGAGSGRVQRVSTALPDSGVSHERDGVGFIKDADHAGYGVKDSRSEAVIGAYRRPKDLNLPATDMYHEGKGAAGVSWSVTLGGH